MFRTLEPLTNVNSEITRCILGEDEIADDASPGLHHVRRQMKITADKVHTQLNAILNSSRTMLQDAVITMRDGRYCLPVRAEYKSQFAGMVHDQSSTGSTLFIEPMAIIKLNNELRELELKEQKEIEMILAALSTELVPYIEPITTDFEILKAGFHLREGGPGQDLQLFHAEIQPERLHPYQRRPSSAPRPEKGRSDQYLDGKRFRPADRDRTEYRR